MENKNGIYKWMKWVYDQTHLRNVLSDEGQHYPLGRGHFNKVWVYQNKLCSDKYTNNSK